MTVTELRERLQVLEAEGHGGVRVGHAYEYKGYWTDFEIDSTEVDVAGFGGDFKEGEKIVSLS